MQMMNSLVIKSDFKSTTFCSSKSYKLSREKEIILVNNKLYQKLIAVNIFLSIFLIFPEAPKELENICESYNSRELCNVW